MSRTLEQARTESQAWRAIVRQARVILRAYSSSFFLVTRFLPPAKRAEVEVIYASVRYPDEVVDTFPISPEEKLALLNGWEQSYRQAVSREGLRSRVQAGVPWILAGFAEVVRCRQIPHQDYLAFLNAMRRDARPAFFATTQALIDDYVYGSAIVVGYFLTHVYGPAPQVTFDEALACARQLGIALQLTNFVRDIFDDHRRSRLYVPLDILADEGITPGDCFDPRHEPALRRAVRRLAETAEAGYDYARRKIGAFAADCRPAIGACIEVYQALNRKFLNGQPPLGARLSVSPVEKFRVLPRDKYWRVPLAYAGLL
jgi:phytoene synthase